MEECDDHLARRPNAKKLEFQIWLLPTWVLVWKGNGSPTSILKIVRTGKPKEELDGEEIPSDTARYSTLCNTGRGVQVVSYCNASSFNRIPSQHRIELNIN